MKTNHLPTENEAAIAAKAMGKLAGAVKRVKRTMLWGDYMYALDIAKWWLSASEYRAFRTNLLSELNAKAAK